MVNVSCNTSVLIYFQLTSDTRRELLQNVWQPESGYKFPPCGERHLRFQHQWLQKFKWLAYSEHSKGAFCKYCVLFAPDGAGVGSQKLGNFVKTPFTNWKKAIDEFNSHQTKKYHTDSLARAQSFLAISLAEMPVNLQLDTKYKEEIEENRKLVLPVIETVMVCGRQGLSLRGKMDSGPIRPLENDEPLQNEGNFRALLRYRAKGDTTLSALLEGAKRNAMYTSPQIQNDIIDKCNKLILSSLVRRVNAAKCFAVLADETTDVSCSEQFSLCVRYVHNDSCDVRIMEDFLQFVPVYDVTGKNLADVILTSLTEYGINLNYLRGQGYDGAAAMRGKFNGVQKHITDKYPLAPYVHCSAHSLNLAISDACKETPIRNCMGVISSVQNFLNTPKRNHVLLASVESLVPESKKKRLKSVCPTRWVERHDAVLVFLELIQAVIDALGVISEWDDRDSASQAGQLMCSILQPEFIITLHVLTKLFSVSLPLCRLLQKQNTDLISALHHVDSVEAMMKSMRTNAEEEFKAIFNQAEKVCNELNIEIGLPRVTKRQMNRCNVKAATPEEYFRISVFIPFVDHFASQLHDRLSSHKSLLSGFMCLLPPVPNSGPSTEQIVQFKELVNLYEADLDCNQEAAVGELTAWYQVFLGLKQTPRNAIDAFCACDEQIFPIISRLLKLFATLPVSTSSVERSFSTLRRLKTYLRNTCGQDRLNGLAMLYIHRDVKVTANNVLDELAKDNRRLNFMQ